MNEPLDILAVAATRLHDAEQSYMATAYMRQGLCAAIAMCKASANLQLAENDLHRVYRLMRELAAPPL